MVLSYYIATQTDEEHLRFLFFSFFLLFTVVFLSFLEKQMQHIPVVSHVLWKGTLILKMMDVVPTIQTTGSYHRQDLCVYLQQGRAFMGPRGREVEWMGENLRCSILKSGFQWRAGNWTPPMSDSEVVSPLQQGQMCLALLTSTWVSAL